MSTPTLRQERITARVNGCLVSVRQTHRWWARAGEAVVVTVTAPVRLSLEDVAAMLFHWTSADPPEELADDDHLRLLVADGVVNQGCGEVEELRRCLDERTLDADRTAYLAYCRQRAAEVFTASPASALPNRSVGVR